jgi:hypothetical protein
MIAHLHLDGCNVTPLQNYTQSKKFKANNDTKDGIASK